METTLYADVLFFVNFSMDFISVWASSYLCSARRHAGRMSLAAAIGGIYGVFAVVAGLSGVFAYISAAAVSVLMALAAFGMPGNFSDLLRKSAVIWGSGALLGGLMTAFLSLFGNPGAENTAGNGGTARGFTAAFAAAALYLTVRIIARAKAGKSVTVTVSHGGRKIELSALCDSGNLLRDPISGDPVMTVSEKALFPLLGEDVSDILAHCRLDEMKELSLKVRIIPHKTGTGKGLSAAFLPDKTEIRRASDRRGTQVNCLIAPIDCPENYFGGYSASFPSDAV